MKTNNLIYSALAIILFTTFLGALPASSGQACLTRQDVVAAQNKSLHGISLSCTEAIRLVNVQKSQHLAAK